jgi:choline dehydrogenase-like flavoprotein
MGPDPRFAPVDAQGAFRGLANLVIADGSVLPTSAAVNPALTIGASALRVGAQLAATLTQETEHVRESRAASPRVSRLRLGHAHP